MDKMENLLIRAEDWSEIAGTENGVPYDDILKNASIAEKIDERRMSEFGLYKKDDEYRTSGYVGINWIKDRNGNTLLYGEEKKPVAMIITPRFKEVDPWEMLVSVLLDSEYHKYVSEDSNRFFEIQFDKPIQAPVGEKGGELLLVLSYLRSLQNLCRKKISKKMIKQEGNFNSAIHGNIKIQKHLLKNCAQGREDRIYCQYTHFTVDTLENRILKAACKICNEILTRERINIPEIQDLIRFCEANLEYVTSIKVKKSDFSNVDISGFNSKYKEPLALAKNLVTHIALNTDKNSESYNMIIPYTIKMESLFEFYIRAKLKQFIEKQQEVGKLANFILDDYRLPGDSYGLKTYNRDNDEIYLMEEYIPDILIQKIENGKKINVAVLDVKYQHSNKDVDSGTRRKNTHQLLSYMLLLNVGHCGFVFPYDGVEDTLEEVPLIIKDGIKKGNLDERKYSQWTIKNIGNPNETFEKILDKVSQ